MGVFKVIILLCLFTYSTSVNVNDEVFTTFMQTMLHLQKEMSSIVLQQTKLTESILTITTKTKEELENQQKVMSELKDQETKLFEKVDALTSLVNSSASKVVDNNKDTKSAVNTPFKQTTSSTENPTHERTYKSCKHLYDDGVTIDGVYPIVAGNGKTVYAYCDMKNGGWLVIQKRFEGVESFDKSFEDYENGFGSLDGEHWLGLENVHLLTTDLKWNLEIEMECIHKTVASARYSGFSIDASPGYNLQFDEYIGGNAGDSLKQSKGEKFTTPDRDQDNFFLNCGEIHKGAWWWYESCGWANLNAFNYPNSILDTPTDQGLYWYRLHDDQTPLVRTTMKIRPQN